MRYIVQWRYKSGYGGPWEHGDSVELDEALAADINRDSPGVLVLTEERALEEPPQDRMVRHAPKRGQYGR